jgi:hypothetical protein
MPNTTNNQPMRLPVEGSDDADASALDALRAEHADSADDGHADANGAAEAIAALAEGDDHHEWRVQAQEALAEALHEALDAWLARQGPEQVEGAVRSLEAQRAGTQDTGWLASDHRHVEGVARHHARDLADNLQAVMLEVLEQQARESLERSSD